MADQKQKNKKWGAAQLTSDLTPEQYKVTQESGTEQPFKNKYWDFKKDGIYVDVVSGEPLFSSSDKYDSGSGWPSFTKPLIAENIIYKEDLSLALPRIEVRSRQAQSHLGHVFDDGPEPTGKRYCINSAALSFIAKEDLKNKGYEDFEYLFKNESELNKITFAGGCFWCMNTPFERLLGVRSVISGYMGGQTPHPTYEQICTGTTGHAEVVQITFDPKTISAEQLIEVFWQNIDPTQVDGQFSDHGSQYRTAIFYHNNEQKNKADASKKALIESQQFSESIVTEVTPASEFYPAEAYHQGYHIKNPTRYNSYRQGSGRDLTLKALWAKKDK